MSEPNSRSESLFAAALAMGSSEERANYLDQACGTDRQLRAHVEELLAAYPKVERFLESPAPAAGATVDLPPVTEHPGTAIGPYVLLQQIGEGGMGVVYMAEQTEPVQRKVALKVIKPGMDSRQVVARFGAERQALALMDHVNIARVFDGGTTESGRPYFVMELVHGIPITKYCDDNHLTPRERLELFVPVCQAIQHAHQKGIIHRDIKPSNVMVTLYDGRPVPKVIDFGVAKATEQKLTERTLFTQYGTMVGTLEYMSPEQAEMSALGVDTRSDIYSLGVLLYELLTGSTPLTQKRMKEAAYAEILRMIKEEEPPKPSTRLADSGEALASISANRHTEPAKLTKLVKGELDWIVMKTLEKDRNRRYETANGFAADVQRYLSDEPVQACPPSARYRLRKFARRNKRALAGSAGLGLALLVATGAVAGSLGWMAREESVRQAILNSEVDLALQDSGRARDLALTQIRNPYQWEATLATALAALKRGEAIAAQDEAGLALGVRDRLNALRATLDADENDRRFVARFDEIRLEQSDVDPETFQFQTETAFPAIREAFQAHYRVDVETTPVSAAVCLFQQRPRRIQEHLVDALDLSRTYVSKDDDQSAQWLDEVLKGIDTDPWRDRARNALAARNWSALDELVKEGIAGSRSPAPLYRLAQQIPPDAASTKLILLRRIQRAHPGDFWVNEELAYTLRNTQPPQWDEAIRYYAAALAVRPRNTAMHRSLGSAIIGIGDLDGAVAILQQALAINPDDASIHNTLGLALKQKQLTDEAIAEYRIAIRLTPTSAIYRRNLGNTLAEKGLLDEAIAEFREAIRIKPNYAPAHNSLGNPLLKQKKIDEAIASYREAIRLKPDYAVAHYNLGTELSNKGLVEEAIEALREAIRLQPTYIDARYNLGNVLRKKGLFEQAIAEFREIFRHKPDDPFAHRNIGLVFVDQRRFDEAIAAFREAVRSKPDYAEAHDSLGWALAETGHLDQGILEYREAIRIKPDLAYAHANLGLALSRKRLYDEAIGAYGEAIRLEPVEVTYHNSLGNVYFKKGLVDEAIVSHRKAIQLKPSHVTAHYNLGIDLHKKGLLKEAEAAYREAIRLKPEYFEAHINLGHVLSDLGRYDDAIAANRDAIRLKPDAAMAHNNLGWAFAQNGRDEDAIACYREAIRIRADYAQPYSNWARLLATCTDLKWRDPNQAGDLAKIAVEMDQKNGDFWNTLGLAHYRAGNWKESVAALQKSMELTKGGGSTDWYFLGMAHWQLGDQDQAREWYDRAIDWMEQNRPNDEELRRFRTEAAELLGIEKKQD